MAAGLLASKLPSALATARPAATSSAGPSCQARLHLFEPDVPGRRPRPGSKGGLCLSSALSYVLPSTGRCRPFPGQDSGCRNEESRAKGDMSNPPPTPPPREAGRAAVQARSSCRGLQEGSGGAFQDTCFAVVPGYCFGFFFLAFTLRLPQKLAVPSTLQEPASPCPARGDAPTELVLPSPGNGTHGIACTDPTDPRSSSSPKA